MLTYNLETKVSDTDPHDIQISITLAGSTDDSKAQHLRGVVTYVAQHEEYDSTITNVMSGDRIAFDPERDVQLALEKVVSHMIDLALELGVQGVEALGVHRRD